ncbi:HK97 gp10 family phage protein [Weissella viridescens]|uniref:HK97 gp10 family phage protein n=1 Tax=Weissella viridescens TaxID=1629 RepID=UPI004056B4BF
MLRKEVPRLGNDDLERQLEQWEQQIARSVNLTVEDQRKVTRAGAEAAKVVIAEETRKNHFESGRDTSKMAHLADSVVVGREEKTRSDGSTSYGFDHDDVNHARIARFLNDGTIKRPGDSFYDHAREIVVGPAQAAMAEKLAKIQERKAR